MNSRVPGFGRLAPAARVALLEERLGLAPGALATTLAGEAADPAVLDRRSEGVLGALVLPLSAAPNFRIDGRDAFVPMATEEPSVVAAASRGALLLRGGEGIRTEVPPRRALGQVQLRDVADRPAARAALAGACDALAADARAAHPTWAAAGGDLLDVRACDAGEDLVALLVLDPGRAQGANLATDLAEVLAPRLESLTGGRAGVRIVSNDWEGPPVRARGRVPLAALDPDPEAARALAEGVASASRLADADVRRAVTHNKGIFNGTDAVMAACGQDLRAASAAGHAFAARDGRYRPLARWCLEGDALVGDLEMPVPVGTVGGAVESRPAVRAAFRILGIDGDRDPARLASAVAAAGLAQNLAALTALAGPGLVAGHLRLHARNLAAALGASPVEVDAVFARLGDEGGRVDRARVAALLAAVRQERDRGG